MLYSILKKLSTISADTLLKSRLPEILQNTQPVSLLNLARMMRTKLKIKNSEIKTHIQKGRVEKAMEKYADFIAAFGNPNDQNEANVRLCTYQCLQTDFRKDTVSIEFLRAEQTKLLHKVIEHVDAVRDNYGLDSKND